MGLNKKVTIKQVAEAAGVSTMTVSRVLNQRPDVSPETRRRVQRVIDELGYAPSAIARSLITGRSNTLGVVSTGLEFYGPSRTLMGIEQQANELGYSLLLNLVYDPETERGDDILEALLSHRAAGILWAVPEIGRNRQWLCQQFQKLDTPVVFLNMQARPCTVTVAVDNREGGRRATEHLLAQGYRKIGIITGPLTWWEARQRLEGWEEALRTAGVEELDRLKAVGDWSPASGEAGLYRLIAQSPDLQAVFSCNDNMALGAMQAARSLGRRIPDDLALVGFDDVPEAAYFYPPLTTIKQGLSEMGKLAVRQLDYMLKEPREPRAEPVVLRVRPQLVVRESSGADRGGRGSGGQ
jgi:LacI family transcriptional regulator